MPKNGNVKKNVSKQVKKDNEQKGGGGSKDTNTVNVVIDFNDKTGKFLFPVLEQWNTTQQIKDSNYPNYISDDNEYYIDSFVSRKILEVLQSHGDKYESIVYDGTDTQTIKNPDIIKEGSSWRFLFTKGIDKPNEVKKHSDIKECDIKDLNTFAMIRNHIDKGKWDDSVYSPNHIISPYKLNFKLTLKEGEDDNESQTLEQRINEQIDDKIKEKVKELESKHEENKKKLAELEKKYEAEKPARDAKEAALKIKLKEEWEQRRAKDEEEAIKRTNDMKKLSEYLYEKFGDKKEKEYRQWEVLVEYDFEKMKKIVDKLKTLEQREMEKNISLQMIRDKDEEDKHRGGAKKSKKLPKKEILGKMISIYKIQGDRKEYVKHKGKLTTIKDYKALMKQKAKKPTKLSKKKKSLSPNSLF
tara:strand:+ start:105 stop:1346 length:1242 start_codon:yes stop_codon:yes gene_type:complete